MYHQTGTNMHVAAICDLMPYGCPGTAVQCVREPHNPYDPDAVAVLTLRGMSLGYVPRELTGAFVHSVTFAHVVSTGVAGDSGLLGATIAVRPSLPPFRPRLPPLSVVEQVDIEARVSAADWRHLSSNAIHRSNGR